MRRGFVNVDFIDAADVDVGVTVVVDVVSVSNITKTHVEDEEKSPRLHLHRRSVVKRERGRDETKGLRKAKTKENIFI